MTAPSVFDYLDYRAFLAQYFAWSREAHRNFSLGRFSRDSGIARSHLSNILAGRREASAEILDTFGRVAGLSAVERRYLTALGDLQAAADLQARSRAWNTIFETRECARALALPAGEEPSFLASWVATAAFELVAEPGFSPDPVQVSERLAFEATPESVEAALALLESTGLLCRSPSGELEVAKERVHALGNVPGAAYLAYHRWSVAMAGRALAELDPMSRSFCASTVRIPVDRLPVVAAELERLVKDLVNLVDPVTAPSESPTEVYQLGAFLYPLTRRPPL